FPWFGRWKKAWQCQVFREPCFLDRSSHVISIVTKSLDGVFGEVVIPGHPVVMEKLEQAIAISEQAVLQGFRCIGLVDVVRDCFEECGHRSGMPLQMPALQPML